MYVQLISCYLLVFLTPSNSEDRATVTISLDAPYRIVADDFLSVTIDAGSISRNWSDIDFTATKIINMAKALVPVTLRVGGTSQDFLIFDPNKQEEEEEEGQKEEIITRKGTLSTSFDWFADSNFYMSPSQWDAVNEFTKAVGWKFIFGLNQRLQDSNGSWNSTNAELLIDYTLKKNYAVDWELGNEPDLYYKHNTTITPQQIVDNFKKLKSILEKKNYPDIFMAGPDVATLARGRIFSDFIEADSESDSKFINAATWHQYYGSSENITLDDFHSVKELDKLYDEIEELMGIASKAGYKGDLWLGETSSSYGGGRALYSESFISGFMWLDKLGVTSYTQKKVFRQDFVGGNYALLDKNQNPLPDYWLSLLYKRLVGPEVLEVKGAKDKGRSVRTYAHCAKQPYPKGSVVLLALNTNTDAAQISLENSELKSSSRDVYWLTPSENNSTSQDVLLNGVKVELVNGDSIPQLQPKAEPSGTSMELPSLSFGYIVFTSANAKACM
ncbi:PREDICTED: heparanase-like [Amphimedon queenslandica]|uniref:Heparanase n=1 Tax=Amphimedon queenslandica TaxID=400682 RepID=A0A1X7VRL3_AMPQE|nr:PREDICTED: heparanase-like [Amphimedon queenslandica]|eukprot:XP_003383078.1 PREDICTED: heparanase-like [Amphimedon queenslandica]